MGLYTLKWKHEPIVPRGHSILHTAHLNLLDDVMSLFAWDAHYQGKILQLLS